MTRPCLVSESFRARADEAAFFESYTASVLTRAGLYVLCHPWKIDGEDYGQSWDLDVSTVYQDQGGYILLGSNGNEGLKVEVKSLNKTFTSPEDYPYDTCLVCSLSSWQKKWPGHDKTQRDFLFVSRKTGAIIWLPRLSKVTITEVEDKDRQGYIQKTVATDKKLLRPLADFVEKVNGA